MRLASAACAVAACAFAAGSLITALTVVPARGLEIDEGRMEVVSVLPGGPTWNAGIRPGQRVSEIRAGSGPDDWSIVTAGSDAPIAASDAAHRDELRSSAPVGLASVLLAAVGVVLLRRRPALATAAASTSAVAAAWPLSLTGEPVTSTLAMTVGPLAGFAWLWAWRPVAWRAIEIGLRVACLVVAAWVAARFLFWEVYSIVELARVAVTAAGTAAVVVLAPPWREWLRTRPLEPARPLDVVVVAGVLGGVVVATLAFSTPPVVSAVALVMLLAVYPLVRRAASVGIDRVVFSSIRERAALEGVEEERGRLAGQIHDVPLQELAGVIHRLDTKADVAAEAALLREIAGHLREITTDLRPPVLEDLGLGPALAFFADRAGARHADVVVSCWLADRTDVDPALRVPPAVELAVYRIVEEAVSNACRHAGARSVRIEGTLAPDALELTVTDDGRGIDRDQVRAARRLGRLGMDSMEQRADAIDASFAVSRIQPHGTRVAITWRAP